MRRVALITGVCGFSGRHLVRYLPTVGDFRLVGLDLCAEPTDLALDDYLRLDLRDPRQAEDAIRRAGPDPVGLLRSARFTRSTCGPLCWLSWRQRESP